MQWCKTAAPGWKNTEVNDYGQEVQRQHCWGLICVSWLILPNELIQEPILPIHSDEAIADYSIPYLSMFEWVDDATRHRHAEQGLRGLKTGPQMHEPREGTGSCKKTSSGAACFFVMI